MKKTTVPVSQFSQPAASAYGKIQGSSVISVYPLNSGIGVYAHRLFNLGLHEELAMFKINGSYPEDGFDRVVKYRFNPNGLVTLFSTRFRSRWSDYALSRSLLHISSPDWFHMIKYNGCVYGTVHDIFVTMHPEWFTLSYRMYFKREMEFAEKLKGVIAVSRFTQKLLGEAFPDVNTSVIHNWTEREFTQRDRVSARQKLGLPVDKTIVLSVGSNLPRKNSKIIPKIMKGLDSDFMLVRLEPFSFLDRNGGSIDGLIEGSRMVIKRDVPLKLIPFYYNAADSLIAPSIEEGFDYPVIEAINSNIPVVASDIEVHKEIMMNRGHFADPFNPDQWAEEIMKAADDKDPWPGFGDYYREERALSEYLKFYGGVS